MSETEFKAFDKIPRLNREIVITEKIDGTNGAIVISEQWEGDEVVGEDGNVTRRVWTTGAYDFGVQSRNRLITPEDDNYGLARWAYTHKDSLIELLGPGHHYGEWWGSGIQRRYGLTGDDKRFSLFNVARWGGQGVGILPGLHVVPELYRGPFDQSEIEFALQTLSVYGSKASHGFMDPEGIIIWHEAARQMFKVTIKDDEKPKGSTEK